MSERTGKNKNAGQLHYSWWRLWVSIIILLLLHMSTLGNIFYGKWLNYRYPTFSFFFFLTLFLRVGLVILYARMFYISIQNWKRATEENRQEQRYNEQKMTILMLPLLIFLLPILFLSSEWGRVLGTPWESTDHSFLLTFQIVSFFLFALPFILFRLFRRNPPSGELTPTEREQELRQLSRWSIAGLLLFFLVTLGLVWSDRANPGFWRDECSPWKRLQGSTCSILLTNNSHKVAWLGETRWLAYDSFQKTAVDLPQFEGIEGIMDRGQRIPTFGEKVWEVSVSADYSTAVLKPLSRPNLILYDIASQTSRLISLPDGYWAETKAGSLSGDGSLIKVYNQSEGAVFDIKRERLLPIPREITFTGYGHESYRYDYENGELTFFSFDGEGVLTESGRLSVANAGGFAFSAKGDFLAYRSQTETEDEIVIINRLTQAQSRFSLGTAYKSDNVYYYRFDRVELRFSADGSRLVGVVHDEKRWNDGLAERGMLFVLQSADAMPLYQTTLYGNLWNESTISLNPSPSAETILLAVDNRTLKYEWASQR